MVTIKKEKKDCKITITKYKYAIYNCKNDDDCAWLWFLILLILFINKLFKMMNKRN
jgi:hypothetical protein